MKFRPLTLLIVALLVASTSSDVPSHAGDPGTPSIPPRIQRRYDPPPGALDAPCVKNGLLRVTKAIFQTIADLRAAYAQKNLDTEHSTPEGNLRAIRAMEETPAGTKRVFFVSENAIMKLLNDTLKDKSLVTSLTNRFKTLLAERTTAVKRAHPEFGGDLTYADFKSLQQIFEDGTHPEFQTALNDAFQSALHDFLQELSDQHLVRASDIHDGWFRSGTGDTADGANFAARYARDLPPGENRVVDVREPEVQAKANEWLRRIEDLRKQLERDLDGKLKFSGPPGKKVPPLAVFDLLRKSKSAEELVDGLDKLRRNSYFNGTQVEIPIEQARMLLEYGQLVDKFSPALRIALREVLRLDDATYGGFTADFMGLGSENLAATASSLVGVETLDHALTAARQGERAVTQRFLERVAALKSIVAEDTALGQDLVRSSGDDCAGVPKTRAYTQAEKLALVNRLARDPRTRAIRIAFFPEGVSHPVRDMLTIHGESIAKELVRNLSEKFSSHRMSQLTFAMDMMGPQAFDGTADVLIGLTDPREPLTKNDRDVIKRALKEAVYAVNRDLTARTRQSRYSGAVIFPLDETTQNQRLRQNPNPKGTFPN